MVCLSDERRLTRAWRFYDGVETDHYRCDKGHEFGMDWREPATEPQWPPPPDVAGLVEP